MYLLRTIGNLFLLGCTFSFYMTYLAIYDQNKFKEIVFLIGHNSIKAYSYAEIYSRKGIRLYNNYLYPKISQGCTFLLNKIKETEIYQKYKSSLFVEKEYKYTENEEETSQYTLEFIKDNEIIYSTTKENIVNNPSFIPEFDFIIGVINEHGIIFNKIFYEIPEKEENFDYQKIYCDVRSFSILKNKKSDGADDDDDDDEDENNLMIDFMSEFYYFWIENNVFTSSFLLYFLKRYYDVSYSIDELKDFHLQIITKEMDICLMKFDEDDSLKVLEKGFEVIKHLEKRSTRGKKSKKE